VCPVSRPHDHEGALAPVKAVYRPAACAPCRHLADRHGRLHPLRACVAACPSQAIDLDMAARDETLPVARCC